MSEQPPSFQGKGMRSSRPGRAETGARTAAVLTALLLASPPAAAREITLGARRAADFVDSVGVNTHFTDPYTIYVRDFAGIEARLHEAGIRHIRDWAIDADGSFSPADQAELFQRLGRTGIRASFGFDLDVSPELVRGFPERVAPAFAAYEMPNELNINHPGDWATALRGWSRRFHDLVRSDPRSRSYPIVGPSLVLQGGNPYAALGDIADRIDFGNMHDYLGGHHPGVRGWGDAGEAPCASLSYASIEYNICHARAASGTRPILSTEVGWGTGAYARAPVPEAVQAKYVLRVLLLHFAMGVPRTYIYQLADSQADEGATHGLLRQDGSAKPAFRALTALMRQLRDDPGGEAAATLRVGLRGADERMRSLLLQKADGSLRLVLWLEAPSFDSARRQALRVPPLDVGLDLAAAGYRARSVSVVRQDGSLEARSIPDRPGPVAIRLTDEPAIVELRR